MSGRDSRDLWDAAENIADEARKYRRERDEVQEALEQARARIAELEAENERLKTQRDEARRCILDLFKVVVFYGDEDMPDHPVLGRWGQEVNWFVRDPRQYDLALRAMHVLMKQIIQEENTTDES